MSKNVPRKSLRSGRNFNVIIRQSGPAGWIRALNIRRPIAEDFCLEVPLEATHTNFMGLKVPDRGIFVLRSLLGADDALLKTQSPFGKVWKVGRTGNFGGNGLLFIGLGLRFPEFIEEAILLNMAPEPCSVVLKCTGQVGLDIQRPVTRGQ